MDAHIHWHSLAVLVVLLVAAVWLIVRRAKAGRP